MEKVIISAALTGAVTPRSINPHIPMTPEEIANDAFECYKAGAAVVHIHMRDDEGLGTMDKDRFGKTAELIKEKCNVIINMTTSGDHRATDEERMAHLIAHKPEMASFDAGSFNWTPAGVFMNTPEFLEKLAQVMIDNNVKPELEIFDSGMAHNANYYMKKGLIKTPAHYQLVLGVLGAASATVEDLVYLKRLLPKDATWSAFGIGKAHLPIMYTTIALGGHIRVGLEDNVYYSKDRLATNVEFVERAARVIKEADKGVATSDEARQILGLK